MPLTIDQMMLRGSVLRNTEWALVIVLYTGQDTKFAQNIRPAPSKRSRMDRNVDHVVLVVFLILCLLSFASVIFSIRWYAGFTLPHQNETASCKLAFPAQRPSLRLRCRYISDEAQEHGQVYLHFIVAEDVKTRDPMLAFVPGLAGEAVELWVTFLLLYNNLLPVRSDCHAKGMDAPPPTATFFHLLPTMPSNRWYLHVPRDNVRRCRCTCHWSLFASFKRAQFERIQRWSTPTSLTKGERTK